MVEQSSTLLDESDAEFLGRLEDGAVVLTTTGSRNVFDTRAGGAEDIVNEWELLYFTFSLVLITFCVLWLGRGANDLKLTNASDETATSVSFSNHVSRSSEVNGVGTSSKTRS